MLAVFGSAITVSAKWARSSGAIMSLRETFVTPAVRSVATKLGAQGRARARRLPSRSGACHGWKRHQREFGHRIGDIVICAPPGALALPRARPR